MDAPKPRNRRTRVDSPAPPSSRPVKVALHLKLDPTVKRKLQVHALCAGKDDSEVVADLINTYLREWVVSRRVGAVGEPVRPDDDGVVPPSDPES